VSSRPLLIALRRAEQLARRGIRDLRARQEIRGGDTPLGGGIYDQTNGGPIVGNDAGRLFSLA
jgi:hypothetical protein